MIRNLVNEEALAHWGAVAPETNKQTYTKFPFDVTGEGKISRFRPTSIRLIYLTLIFQVYRYVHGKANAYIRTRPDGLLPVETCYPASKQWKHQTYT